MTTETADYKVIQQHQLRLTALLEKTEPLLYDLDMKERAEINRRLRIRVASDRFKVLIMGEFKRGKSTFINALLGEEILPSFAIPCTAVINEIRWGEQKKAFLFFRKPLPAKLPDSLPPAARDHIQRMRPGENKPMVIPISDLERYVAIPDPARDQAESIAQTPYDKVMIYWPIDLCKNGVEIVDSPGLNEHGIRQKITVEYLNKVDAVVFVLSCHALGARSEMEIVDQRVRGAGHEDIFFVCNRFDEIREKQREPLVKFGQDKLKDKTSFGVNGVYFLSALEALEGRLTRDAIRVEKSGVPPFEKALAHFLVHHKGKIKLLRPARELQHTISLVRNQIIPQRKALLDKELADLQARYNRTKPKLTQKEEERQQILKKIGIKRQRLHKAVRDAAERRIRDLADKLPTWAQELQPEKEIKFVKFDGWMPQGFEAQAKLLIEDVTAALTDRMEQEQAEWAKNDLQPLIQSLLVEMDQEINRPIEDFLKGIDKIKADLTGLSVDKVMGGEQVGGIERVLAAAGGLFLGGVGSAFVGGMMGYQEMLKSLLPQVGLVVAFTLLAGFNPFVLIPALLGAGFLQGLWKSKSLTDKVKMDTAEKMAGKLKERAASLGEEMAGDVDQMTDEFTQRVSSGLENMIAEIREQVEATLRDKRGGEAKDQEARQRLVLIEFQLQEVEKQLSDLVFTVGGLSGRHTTRLQ